MIINLIIGYLIILIIIAALKFIKFKGSMEIGIGAIRMSVQLFLMSLILGYIFSNASPVITIIALLIMELFAYLICLRKFKNMLNKKIKKEILMSIFIGANIVIIFFIFVILKGNPWFDPKIVIPFSGMIIGNTLTGLTLAINSLLKSFKSRRDEINEILILGGTIGDASKEIVEDSFSSAITPLVNSMLGMGIVYLPGMTTGQIINGADPTQAIYYQIMIIIGMLASVILTTLIFLFRGRRTFFSGDTLVDEEK